MGGQQDLTDEVFITNLPAQSTHAQLRRALNKLGIPNDVILNIQKAPQAAYGFAKFPDKQKAERAVATIGGQRILGKRIHAAIRRPQITKDVRTLIVTGLPSNYVKHYRRINDVTRQFGISGNYSIVKVELDECRPGNAKATLKFGTKPEAAKAVTALNGLLIDATHRIQATYIHMYQPSAPERSATRTPTSTVVHPVRVHPGAMVRAPVAAAPLAPPVVQEVAPPVVQEVAPLVVQDQRIVAPQQYGDPWVAAGNSVAQPQPRYPPGPLPGGNPRDAAAAPLAPPQHPFAYAPPPPHGFPPMVRPLPGFSAAPPATSVDCMYM